MAHSYILTEVLQDRNAVLQKSKTLKGCHVVISEDFPRDVMLKRRHLINFAKQVSIKLTSDRLILLEQSQQTPKFDV